MSEETNWRAIAERSLAVSEKLMVELERVNEKCDRYRTAVDATFTGLRNILALLPEGPESTAAVEGIVNVSRNISRILGMEPKPE